MTRREFMTTLRRSLKEVPASDVDRIVEYYEEIIADRMEEGLPEEEVVAALGNLEEIVANVTIEGTRYRKWYVWGIGVLFVMALLISVIIIAGDTFDDIDDWSNRSEITKEIETVTQAEVVVADTELQIRFHNENTVKIMGQDNVVAWFTVRQVKGELKIVQETWDYMTDDDDIIIYLPQNDYKLSVHSDSGDIEINGYAGDSLNITSGSGSVELQLKGEKSEYTVKAQSMQGEIEAPSGDGDKMVEIYTHEGDIEVEYKR